MFTSYNDAARLKVLLGANRCNIVTIVKTIGHTSLVGWLFLMGGKTWMGLGRVEVCACVFVCGGGLGGRGGGEREREREIFVVGYSCAHCSHSGVEIGPVISHKHLLYAVTLSFIPPPEYYCLCQHICCFTSNMLLFMMLYVLLCNRTAITCNFCITALFIGCHFPWQFLSSCDQDLSYWAYVAVTTQPSKLTADLVSSDEAFPPPYVVNNVPSFSGSWIYFAVHNVISVQKAEHFESDTA